MALACIHFLQRQRGKGGASHRPSDTSTGQVANSTTDFVVSQGGKSGAAAFIFASFEPGTISGWNPSVNPNAAVVVVNASAWYTGLAMGVNNGSNFLFGADNLNNKVDIYDGTFKLVGKFTDSTLTGLAVYGVQNINGKLYVTFADSAFTKGAVDVVSTSGKLIKRLTKDAHLKAPWGVALAPKNFGPASNALLVGNVSDGRINVFNAKTGKFMTQLQGYEQQGHQHQWPLGAGFRPRRRNERQPQPTVLHRRPERIRQRSVRRDQL